MIQVDKFNHAKFSANFPGDHSLFHQYSADFIEHRRQALESTSISSTTSNLVVYLRQVYTQFDPFQMPALDAFLLYDLHITQRISEVEVKFLGNIV